MNMKVLEIGDWNMDTTASVTVAHGITQGKIRSATAMIRHDTESNGIYNLDRFLAGQTGVNGIVVTAASIQLSRATGGTFDASTFDSTSYNRGWITIWYTD